MSKMDLRSWLRFNLWYYRRPPWDTGISPPELYEFLQDHPAGRALDLGCGTGTNVLTLASYGWQVTGIDFARRAVAIARARLREEEADADVRVGDVTQLQGISGPFELCLDIGCYHSLPLEKRRMYRKQLDRVLAPGGYFLLYGFLKTNHQDPGPGLTEEGDLSAFDSDLELVRRIDSANQDRSAVWVLYQKE